MIRIQLEAYEPSRGLRFQEDARNLPQDSICAVKKLGRNSFGDTKNTRDVSKVSC